MYKGDYEELGKLGAHKKVAWSTMFGSLKSKLGEYLANYPIIFPIETHITDITHVHRISPEVPSRCVIHP